MEFNTGKNLNPENKSLEKILSPNSNILKYSVEGFVSKINRASNIELDNFCAKLKVPIGLPRGMKQEKLKQKFISEKSKANIYEENFEEDGILPENAKKIIQSW